MTRISSGQLIATPASWSTRAAAVSALTLPDGFFSTRDFLAGASLTACAFGFLVFAVPFFVAIVDLLCVARLRWCDTRTTLRTRQLPRSPTDLKPVLRNCRHHFGEAAHATRRSRWLAQRTRCLDHKGIWAIGCRF